MPGMLGVIDKMVSRWSQRWSSDGDPRLVGVSPHTLREGLCSGMEAGGLLWTFQVTLRKWVLTLREGGATYPGELAREGLRKIGPNDIQCQGFTESL